MPIIYTYSIPEQLVVSIEQGNLGKEKNRPARVESAGTVGQVLLKRHLYPARLTPATTTAAPLPLTTRPRPIARTCLPRLSTRS
jgi:hypothetical protein